MKTENKFATEKIEFHEFFNKNYYDHLNERDVKAFIKEQKYFKDHYNLNTVNEEMEKIMEDVEKSFIEKKHEAMTISRMITGVATYDMLQNIEY